MPSPAPLTDRIAQALQLRPAQVEAAVRLLDEGNTIPFITRYRKEATGNLDEEKLRLISEELTSGRQLEERASAITRLLQQQQQLTPELEASIRGATSLKQLEDLYLPFRPKRKTRATIARQRGLEPLATRILHDDRTLGDLQQAAKSFISTEQGLNSVEEVLSGAQDIIVEWISENSAVREACRQVLRQTGRLQSTGIEKATPQMQAEYRDYLDFSDMIMKIPPHRLLALNRGEREEVLRIKVSWDKHRAQFVTGKILNVDARCYNQFMNEAIAEALERHLLPSLDRELRKDVTLKAEKHAIDVFARNLRNLLLQPPLSPQRVLAIDPGLRTGCKLAVLNETGDVLALDVVYITGNADRQLEARNKIVQLVREHGIKTIAIGNGTACRETEELVAQAIRDELPDVHYIIVNEAGASIYSASTIAREEFPELDATARGTISIARRLLDPLSELVKIEPQHLGVGMYQHDIPPKQLKSALDGVVESCVNYVGVDLNTASASLLRYVSGLNQLLAKRIVDRRKVRGPFRNRAELLEVQGIGPTIFTQAAGFLKVAGSEPLDGTWIHPESYPATKTLLEKLQVPLVELTGENSTNLWRSQLLQQAEQIKQQPTELERLASDVHVGMETLRDILDSLLRPGRDPRLDLPKPVFRQDILRFEDLAEGVELEGTILNVVDFGAFVDIGLKDSALIHVSKMSNQFIRNPHEIVSVGDRVTVWVADIDKERRRVGLSLIRPQPSL
ncbi:RNA binding S1 domain protein [Planctopirus limnophila DSM 3776]|uniref:RNA binding S1 domain protein n=1 Tax=Planctopirus limnophila (strain ATCC 43296 / DSM 3776 / IFAM 1008 / Mu 290) TaxID=521674 RepID=D5SP95_PLAL2|nr:Tex family protein [Planctopirus limnophila]ADG68239.1 RNA binding S1 domain protein [Planctopirus limnophila DSM 3776]